MKRFLRPGSTAALMAGCSCAVHDNHYGEGFMMDGRQCFWMNQSCKLHGSGVKQAKEEISKTAAKTTKQSKGVIVEQSK